MWCPNCKIEYRKGITVCADCGSELVERDGEYGIDICEISDEAVADEVVAFLEYSGIEGVEKESIEGGVGFRITVPEKAERRAEKLFHGYMLAKEEEKEEAEDEALAEAEEEETAEVSFSEEEEEPEDNDNDGTAPEEEVLFAKDVEVTEELLHSSNKNEYIRMAERYRDMKFSGITFIIFGVLGGVYLVLSKLKVIPIQYNMFILCVIAVLFGGFFIAGVVSCIKSTKFKKLIPIEEEKTSAIRSWLDNNLTKEMVSGWSDAEVSAGENDLLITAHIRTMLTREYPKEPEPYLELLAEEYYEEHFFGDASEEE